MIEKKMAQILAAIVAAATLATAASAQEQSVKPGINDNFRDANVEQYVKIFEGPGRSIYDHRHEIVKTVGLKAGMELADIGAGTGFFARMFAKEVGGSGTIYAVDIAKNFIEHIDEESKKAKIRNIEAILCSDRSTKLKPESVDVVFVCDTYHHFEYPFDTLASIHQALRPGGSLVIVDFQRIQGVSSSFAIGHVRGGKGTVTDEVIDSGFDFIEEVPMMKDQYIIKFKKRS